MIPAEPLLDASAAEKRVFEELRKVDLENAVCLFSVGLPRHQRKLSAEADFVILHDFTLLVIEVKGGGVSVSDGVWTYERRDGRRNTSREGPFRQAESAMFTIRSDLRNRFGEVRWAFGIAVAFPDCDFGQPSVEWTDEAVWDRTTIRNGRVAEAVATSLEHARRRYVGNRGGPTHAEVLNYLRPSIQASGTLAASVDEADRELSRYTSDQLLMLDAAPVTDRLLCAGGAGTGKTYLALELARRARAAGGSVTLVSRSPLLLTYLAEQLRGSGVVVSRGAGDEHAPASEVLIVDEAQDLMSAEGLEQLERLVEGGLERGRWAFFYDDQMQAGVNGPFEPEALVYLRSLGGHPLRLPRNCRNTSQIVERTRELTGCDIGVPVYGAGPDVTVIQPSSPRDAVDALRAAVDGVLADGASPGEVTILGPEPLGRSLVSKVPQVKQRVVTVRSVISAGWPSKHLTYAEIGEFKGMENRYIILTDIRSSSDADLRALYTGMTRARVHLTIIFQPSSKGAE